MTTDAESTRLSGLLARVARGEELGRDERAEVAQEAQASSVLEGLNLAGWPAAGTVEERIEQLRRAARFAPVCPLDVAGYSIEARVSLEDLWRVYLPLCSALAGRGAGQRGPHLLVGIAGAPGSGKSTFAILLAELLNALAEAPRDVAVAVPLDGFHLPNAYLNAHTVADADGGRRPLRMLKGKPETYDVAGFVEALERLRSDERVALPRYDRRLHDPVEGGIVVEPHHRIVLVEGNYLLVQEGGWEAVAPLLDLRLFMSMPLDAVRPGMLQRHIRGGRTPGDAQRHFALVDLPNYDTAMRSLGQADLVIERGEGHRLIAVTARGKM